MTNSSQRVTSDGTLSTLAISIAYFDRTEISVLFDGVVTTTGWSWVGTSDKTLQFTPSVPNGVEVTVQRSSDITEIRHEFSLGAAFKAGAIDENFKQILHIAQEARENPVYTDIFNDVHMHGYKFKHLADGVDPTDSVNMQQLTAQEIEVQSLLDSATESINTLNTIVGEINGVVDAAGNLYITNELKFADPNAVITGDFNTVPLRIKGNSGISTQIQVESPTGGTGSQLTLACNPAGTNNLGLYSDVGQSTITSAPASALDYQKPLALQAGYGAPVQLLFSPGNMTYEAGFWFRGPRMFCDLSDANLYKRMMFQSSVSGGTSTVGVAPNGAAIQAGFQAYNNSDVSNASTTSIITNAIASKIVAGKTGTGSYKPLALNVGGADVATYSEAAATLGNMTASVARNSALVYSIINADAGTSAASYLSIASTAGSLNLSKLSPAGGSISQMLSTGGGLYLGTSDSTPIGLITNGATAATLDTNGNLLCIRATGGLGYGPGAGGSVTQTTSKSTPVTLNKPCGRITMHNASLASGASVFFNLSNTLISQGDTLTFGLWVGGAASTAAYRIEIVFMGPQSVGFKVTNISAGALSESLEINFVIHKGSNA